MQTYIIKLTSKRKQQRMFIHNTISKFNRKQPLMKTKLILVMICCCLTNLIVESSQLRKDNNVLVVKNNKIVHLVYDNNDDKEQENRKVIRIQNSQQWFKIQLPLQSNNKQIQFLSQYLSTLSTLLNNKGYLKPYVITTKQSSKSNNKQFIRGYKYIKPIAYHSANNQQDTLINEEINSLMKMLIKSNNLTYLNLRLQDHFYLQIIPSINNTNQQNNAHHQPSISTITHIDINYLFPTVNYTTIPSTILQKLSIKQHSQLSSTNKLILQRKLSGKGLHQSINFTLTLNDQTDIQLQPLKQQCYFQFTDILPQTTYVDVDQRRQEIQNYQVINVEKPAFDSKQYFYKYTVALRQFKQIGVNKYLYQQPIHFRYPEPSLLNFTKVYLHSIQSARIVCKQQIATQQRKHKQFEEKVYEVEENALFDRGTAKLPNADISKQKIVSIATLAVCLVTVLMIVSRLKKF